MMGVNLMVTHGFVQETMVMTGSIFTTTIALTPAGRAELEQELLLLRIARLPALTARLADVQGGADAWDEAAVLRELHEEQLRLERRVGDLERLLAAAGDVAPGSPGVVTLGSHVDLEGEGERGAYQLVDPREANVAAGRLSITSPLGRALAAHRSGDAVLVTGPIGEHQVRIVAVTP